MQTALRKGPWKTDSLALFSLSVQLKSKLSDIQDELVQNLPR